MVCIHLIFCPALLTYYTIFTIHYSKFYFFTFNSEECISLTFHLDYLPVVGKGGIPLTLLTYDGQLGSFGLPYDDWNLMAASHESEYQHISCDYDVTTRWVDCARLFCHIGMKPHPKERIAIRGTKNQLYLYQTVGIFVIFEREIFQGGR